ncbi:hypothetical protein ARALYDRAFT_904099 [Arabidopsis lyrata subsp. lyrata]|uniref:Cyclic nucleotide-binding domain-containing protein n=1 Tax=Arabidopsis lyrata subsp. lyrata TaxID=81972 RepID=D7LEI5_ARALL|nr:hypothetical protein ARALYDRAFT_904099 [Arabidopsis lyrata subsp. lyrata]
MITISALNASLLSLSLLIASFCCSRRICYCSLGFSRGANAKEEFLKEVNRVEEFLKDPCVSSKVFNGDTVQVRVPKVVPAPQTASILGVGMEMVLLVLELMNWRRKLLLRRNVLLFRDKLLLRSKLLRIMLVGNLRYLRRSKSCLLLKKQLPARNLLNHTRNLASSVDGKFKSGRGRLKKFYRKMKTLENWRKTVLLACVVALAIDPLFLFIPLIDSHRFCFTFDKTVVAVVCVIRTLIDTFYVIHIIYYLITEIIAPRSQASLRGKTVEHSKDTMKTRLLFRFMVDIFSVLPIPQVVVVTLIPRSASLVSEEILKLIILCQYLPRIIRMYPLYKEVTGAVGTVAESKWINAASLNFFLYILHSYDIRLPSYLRNLICKRGGGDNSRFLNKSCPLIDPDKITNSTDFDFGLYIDALKSGVLEVKPRDFPRKFVYCFWWGLRNISALGQNLQTSNSTGEIIFAIIICVSGLLLFAVLIANVQVPWLSFMDDGWLLEAVCDRVKPVFYSADSYIVREGHPVEEMLIVTRAMLESSTTGSHEIGGRGYNCCFLEAGDICGELLFNGSRLPTSTRTVMTMTEVEGFILLPDDVNFIASHLNVFQRQKLQQTFRQVSNQSSTRDFFTTLNKLQDSNSPFLGNGHPFFRFYSEKWQSWAVFFTQRAWREHCKRKLSKILRAK